MPKAEKIERVNDLKERIEGSQALLLTDYRGLTVSDITELRRSLAEGGASFAVVKNTLMRRAVADAGVGELEAFLDGPSAVAFVAGDPVAAAKKVVDAGKRFPTLVIKGGYLEGKVLSADDAKALADLESREVMLSKIAGMLKSEMVRAAAMFAAAPSKLLSLLDAYREKLPVAATDATDPGAGEAATDAGTPQRLEAATEAPAEPEAATETEAPSTVAPSGQEPETEAATDAADEGSDEEKE
jgi:large subunit ribosomal protein L10